MLDEDGVEQPTCDIIHDDYVGEPRNEQESLKKDDSLPSTRLLHHLDIFHDSVIFVESCENLVSNDDTNFDHS